MGEKTKEMIKEEIRHRKRERKRAAKERQQREMEQQARQKRFLEIASSVVLIRVRFIRSDVIGEYIIVEKEQDADPKDEILHFKSKEARELLTAAFYSERNMQGSYNNFAFTVCEVIPRKDASHFMKLISPAQVRIRPKGGFQESILNRRYTLMSLLLYSPFSKRFEIMPVTHDRNMDICFTDISNFRYFIIHNGNPHLNLDFEPVSGSSSSKFEFLNEESALYGYGYTVSKADSLSFFYRQQLLGEIIDIPILSPYRIIKYLEFFIQTHPSHSYDEARSKWEEDLRFVHSYKHNPDRFLVVSEKKQKPPAWTI